MELGGGRSDVEGELVSGDYLQSIIRVYPTHRRRTSLLGGWNKDRWSDKWGVDRQREIQRCSFMHGPGRICETRRAKSAHPRHRTIFPRFCPVASSSDFLWFVQNCPKCLAWSQLWSGSDGIICIVKRFYKRLHCEPMKIESNEDIKGFILTFL